MLSYVILLLPALIVMFVMKYIYNKEISTKEFLIHGAICIISATVVLALSYAINYASLTDTQILNGKVLSKNKHVETCTQYSSCEHYYVKEKCHYYTDSKGKRHKSCETYKVFDYPYEVDWYVNTSVGDFKIKRINRQGTTTPNRWSVVKINDYASNTSYYINYLLSDKNSLFSTENDIKNYSEKYLNSLPEYPEIFDYYHTEHVINTTKADVSGFDEYIKDELKDLGSSKQVNIEILIYDYKDVDFVDAVLLKWKGGKKNDVIMFFGIDENSIVKSFVSTSFAKGVGNEELHSKMRIDALQEKLNLDLIKKEVHNISTKFVRQPNENFSYLATKLEPRKDVMILVSIILLILSYFVGLYMRDNEV